LTGKPEKSGLLSFFMEIVEIIPEKNKRYQNGNGYCDIDYARHLKLNSCTQIKLFKRASKRALPRKGPKFPKG